MPPSLNKTRSRTAVSKSAPTRSATPRRSADRAAAAWVPPWMADLVWIVWVAVAAVLALSLLSFSPNAQGWFPVSAGMAPENWLGRFGAALADGLVFMLGLSSAWLVLLSLVLAWDAWRLAAGLRRQQALSDPAQRFAAQSSSPSGVPSRLWGFLLLIASSAALEAQRLGLGDSFFANIPGGAVGSFLGSTLEWLMGQTGLTLVTLVSFFVGLSLFLRFSWIGFFESLGQGTERSVQVIRAW
ncbi:MAG: DNA translocase FtsK 4TM domain-containing protein, partial [Burkholderiaceae bacterium]